MEKIRLFIGSSPDGDDALAEMAYEYTLRKNCSRELEIVWMRRTNNPNSFWHDFDTTDWATPFTGFRWGIPEYCNYEGKAIYTDADMLNFRDISELFDIDLGDNYMAVRKDTYRSSMEFCVAVLNCEKMKETPAVNFRKKHAHLDFLDWAGCKEFYDKTERLHPAWNSLDGDVNPFYQLHYTNMATQPWKPKWYWGKHRNHRYPELETLFWEKVEEAKAAGYNEEDYKPSSSERIEGSERRGYW